MKQSFTLPWDKAKVLKAVEQAGDGYTVIIDEPKRSLDQNRLLWRLLHCVADQVVWHGQKLTAENWKDVFSASLKKQQVVPSIDRDGGFVVLGASTSKMTKPEMSDLLELIMAFGSERGVKFDL